MCLKMDHLRLNCELVGDSHALRMGNVLNNRPYTRRQEGLAVSGLTTKELLHLVIHAPPRKPVILVIGCNDIIQTLKQPLTVQKREFKARKEALFALLKQMTQYSCLVLEVFPIPRMEELYGEVARYYLSVWNLIINKFNGLGGIRMVKTQHLTCFPNNDAKKELYEKYIGPQNDPDYIHLNNIGYTVVLRELVTQVYRETF